MRIAVLGSGGFIAGHLVRQLLCKGHELRVIDIKPYAEWWQRSGGVHKVYVADLREPGACLRACIGVDQIYNLAADMGGAGYVFTGENDAQIIHNSALINLNVAESARRCNVQRILWTSSACIYPAYNQTDPDNPHCEEESAYPAMCDSEYGWEKLFSERMYAAYMRNHGLEVRIARLHNVMGTHGSWDDGKEKAPAAACRKVAEANDGEAVEVWGDGLQTRSFMHVDDCVEGLIRLMASDHKEPINLGREEMISINDLFDFTADIAGKKISLRHDLTKPQGVRGRTSDNTRLRKVLGWEPSIDLREGISRIYPWILEKVQQRNAS